MSCIIDLNDTSYILRESVQAATSMWELYINLVGFLPAIISVITLGSLGDIIGRKVLFILPPIGIAMKAGIIIAGQHFNLPIWIYFFNNVDKLLGGNELIFVACYSYISDTCSKDNLAMRILIIELICTFTSAFYIILCWKILKILA